MALGPPRRSECGVLSCRLGHQEPPGFPEQKELYFIAPDLKMMAAEVRTSGTSFEAGMPTPLFQTRIVADVTTRDKTQCSRKLMKNQWLAWPRWHSCILARRRHRRSVCCRFLCRCRKTVRPDSLRRLLIVFYRDNKSQIYLRSLDSPELQPLAGTDNARSPFWSPDSRYIGFFAEEKLKVIPAVGGPARVLCSVGVRGAATA